MSRLNQYKWLIVVEGDTDVGTFTHLFDTYDMPVNDMVLFSAHGKGNVCNAENWNRILNESQVDLVRTIKTDIGRVNFTGVILIIDSDSDNEHAFDAYKRNPDNSLYATPAKPPISKGNGKYWLLDTLNGVHSLPIIGINIPMNKSGCLETDLLDAYGFPIKGQDEEYNSIVDVIEKTSPKWNIPKLQGGGNWWDENKKAKLDKFIYSALLHGFSVCRQTPKLPTKPNIIIQIEEAIAKNTR